MAGLVVQANQQSALGVAEEERNREFTARWEKGGFYVVQAYSDLMVRKEAVVTG